jgi:hypothetical protein
MPAITLEALPADEGDCLLLTCHARDGDRHVLVDAGTPATAPRLLARLATLARRRLELLVVSHIDTDHIGGAVRLLRDPAFDVEIGDAWFNGYRHLPKGAAALAQRGVPDAERLTDLLTGDAPVGGASRELPWNLAFDGAAVMRAADDRKTGETTADLPVITYPWGLTLTLLSPTPKRLDALFTNWDRYLVELRAERPSAETQEPLRPAGRGASLEDLAARPTTNDTAGPNGSSIAFLAEFGGRSLLFGADAFPTVLYPALLRLARARAGVAPDTPAAAVPPLHVDVFKLPHHGSRANVAFDLFGVVRAEHYLVSTSGSRFAHPDEEGMARVITRGRTAPGRPLTLWFNYASDTTLRWMDPALKRSYDYATAGAVEGGASGATLVL